MDSITETYYKTFGFPTKKPLLYDTEEEYINIRKYIINKSKSHVLNKKESNQTSGSSPTPLVVRRRQNEISTLELRGVTIFYLKKISGSQTICDAAGYYDKEKDNFIFIKYSQISKDAKDFISDIYVDLKGNCFLTNNYTCSLNSAKFRLLSCHSELCDWKTIPEPLFLCDNSLKHFIDNIRGKKCTRNSHDKKDLYKKISEVISSLTSNL